MYIVYVFPKSNRTARNIYDPYAERHMNDCVGECKRQQAAVGDEDGTAKGAGELGTFLFQGRHAEAMAKRAAERLAKACPGDEVYMSTVTQVTMTAIPTLVNKAVSEKGVLPL